MAVQGTYVRIARDRVFHALVILLAACSIVPLAFILYYITVKGFNAINWEFVMSLPKPVGEVGGGISNAIVGTLMLVIIASCFAIPVGVMTGVFLSENRNKKVAHVIRSAVEILMGIPSIILGIIAYAWVVMPMGGFSALSGGVALAIMMLPVIIRSTEETLNLIPNDLKEASLAIGVPYYRTILKVIIPAGLSGIVTGALLGVARIAGETAPLLFTAFGSPWMNVNIFKPVNSMPLLIYYYATSPYEDWHSIAWGASFVLIVFILALNLITKLVTRK
jgi:phosphate transport system permease protein